MRWRKRGRWADLDPDQVQEIISSNVALAGTLPPHLSTQHLVLTQELTETKHWEAAAGFELNADIVTTIAANAAIAIVGLDSGVYRLVKSIIVHPTTTLSQELRSGPGAATVSDTAVAVIGVATPNSGPMTLSWDAVQSDSQHPATGRNVVIHEFAHKIDMSDGYTDGIPPAHGESLRRWTAVLDDEYERTKARRSDRVLRAYAWTNRAEFFAVSTEAFFCNPTQLQAGKPELYSALADFYQQDPAKRTN